MPRVNGRLADTSMCSTSSIRVTRGNTRKTHSKRLVQVEKTSFLHLHEPGQMQAPLHQFAHRASTSQSRRCHINTFLGFAAQQNLTLLLDSQAPLRIRKPSFSYDQVWAWAEDMVVRRKCKTEQSDRDSYRTGKPSLPFSRSHARRSPTTYKDS